MENFFGSKETNTAKPVASKKVGPTTATKGLVPFVKAPVKPKGFQMPPATPWTSGPSYAKKVMVTLEGKTYKSKKDNNTSTPSSTAADWTLVK